MTAIRFMCTTVSVSRPGVVARPRSFASTGTALGTGFLAAVGRARASLAYRVLVAANDRPRCLAFAAEPLQQDGISLDRLLDTDATGRVARRTLLPALERESSVGHGDKRHSSTAKAPSIFLPALNSGLLAAAAIAAGNATPNLQLPNPNAARMFGSWKFEVGN